MSKVIREILGLLWKLFRLLLWKWIQPLLSKLLLVGFVLVTVLLVILMVTR